MSGWACRSKGGRIREQQNITSSLTCILTLHSALLHYTSSSRGCVVRARELHLGLCGTLGEGAVAEHGIYQGEGRNILLIQNSTILRWRQKGRRRKEMNVIWKYLTCNTLKALFKFSSHDLGLILRGISPTSVCIMYDKLISYAHV